MACRYLFAVRGSEISVEIVAPGVDEIAKRIGEDCLGKVKEVKLHNMKLEEYVSLISESSPSLVRQAVHEFPEVRDWLERIYVSYKLQGSGYPFAAEGEKPEPNQGS